MRWLVIVRLREAIVGELVPAAQQAIGAEMQRLLGSGKVADSGVFTDDRAGFLILNADSADELFDLVGGLLDLARLEVHPLTTYERLGAFFEQQAARRTSGAGHP